MHTIFIVKIILFLFILFPPKYLYAENSSETTFSYKLGKKDFIIAPISLGMNIGAGIVDEKVKYNLTINEIGQLNREKVNRFDQSATYNWSTEAGTVSDVFYKAMPIIAPSIAIPQLFQKEWKNAATIGVMYLELFFLTKSLTLFTKSASKRIRPYLYNDSFSLEERFEMQGNEAPSASTSFFSGHTIAVFASGAFLSKVYQDVYGKSVWSRLIWGTTMSIGVVTAYSRVKSGEHFATDVIAGGLVGVALGYLIPQIHKTEKVNLSASSNSISFTYYF